MRTALIPLILAILWPLPGATYERLTFGLDDLDGWDFPRGLVTIDESGLQVKRFAKSFNAVSTIDGFRGLPVGDHGTQAVRTQSGAATADMVRDGDPDTWWSPSTDDSQDKWWIELDLGRTVVADKLRLIFADADSARPFTFFAALTSPGVRVVGSAGSLQWTRVDRPGQLNTDRVARLGPGPLRPLRG